MRDFLDSILSFIAADSLTDGEWAAITLEVQEYSAAVYTVLLGILDDRESVSSTRDRLRSYFLARGTQVESSSAGKSNIYLGSGLCT